MTRSSLQLRLLSTAAVAVAASLSLAGLGITALFERQMQRLVAVELSHTLHLLLAQVKVGPDSTLQVPQPPIDPRFATIQSGLYWQIGDRGGVRLRSRSLWDDALRLTSDERDHTAEHVFAATGPLERPVLVAERWVEISAPEGPRPIQIAVASDMSAIADALGAFEKPLIASLCVLAIGLILAAWAFVRTGLEPFGRLRTDLAAVHEGRSTRLSGNYPDEVRPVVRDLNTLLQRQEEIAARAPARAADLAHGLKTPLAVLAALAADVRDAGQPLVADEIDAEVDVMKGHVERELARARSAQVPPLSHLATPIRPVAERLAAALAKISGRDELRFDIDCPDAVVFAGSENDLFDMLGNLLDNARKWARTRVRIAVAHAPGSLRIVVDDDGPGLPEAGRADDLAPASRPHDVRTGSGLGLAITKDVAEANRGRLQLGRSGLGGLEVALTFAES